MKPLWDKVFKIEGEELLKRFPCIAFTVFLYKKPTPVKIETPAPFGRQKVRTFGGP